MSESDKEKEHETVQTDFGFVGVNDTMDMQGFGAEAIGSQLIGGQMDIVPEDADYSVEMYGGVNFDGDVQLGMRGTKNLIEKTTPEGDLDYRVNAVADLLYATRAGGITSSMGIQAEANMMENHLNLRGEVGYRQAFDSEKSGFYARARADYDFSKDPCTGFIEKGCLTNLAQAMFSQDEGLTIRNELLHDVTYNGQDLNLRIGPSVEYNTEDEKMDVGVAARVSFEF
ncbi:MAG: hypothetical protein NZ828_05340 [Alphaproteobacteria bacterium]|nr:hypothetical protein [Alphaproteobacteria bacterium]